jgi:hypothetical protein
MGGSMNFSKWSSTIEFDFQRGREGVHHYFWFSKGGEGVVHSSNMLFLPYFDKMF